MKKAILILACILFLTSPLWAGEKEELKLQAELYQERLIRMELQSQFLQQQYQETKKKLVETKKKIKKSTEKEGLK